MARRRPSTSPPTGAGVGVATQVGLAGPATSLGGAAGIRLGAEPALVGARLTSAVVDALRRLSVLRLARMRQYLYVQGAPEEEVAALLRREAEFEREFRRRSEARVRAGVELAINAPDPSAKGAAVENVIRRERRFAQQRAEAQSLRLHGALERDALRRVSPHGAYWELGNADQHTPDCLAMAGKVWPWEVLDILTIPMHPGCQCRLRSYGDALAAGIVRPSDVLSIATARKLAGPVIDYVEQHHRQTEEEALDELELRLALAEVEDLDLNVLAAAPLEVDEQLRESTVNVGGYRRKDGTWVHSYTRLIRSLEDLVEPGKPTTRVSLPDQTQVSHNGAQFVVSHPDMPAEQFVSTPQEVASMVGTAPDPNARRQDPGERVISTMGPRLMEQWGERAAETVETKLGVTKGTDDVYETGDGKWDPERAQMHNEVVSSFVNQALGGGGSITPQAMFMAGGPASGKSGLRDSPELAGVMPLDAVPADVDGVRSVIPEYRVLRDADRVDASSRVHEEASYLNKRVVASALAARANIVIDAVGGSDTITKQIHNAKQQGYDVSVVYATQPTEDAIRNAAKRAERTGRAVPAEYITAAHAAVSKNFDAVVRSGATIRLYDTRVKDAPALIAISRNGKLTILDKRLYNEFRAKAKG